LAETFYRLKLLDEMKETAMLEWMVLPVSAEEGL